MSVTPGQLSRAVTGYVIGADWHWPVAVETLKIYEERNIVEHVRKVGGFMQAELRKLIDHPPISLAFAAQG